jgi:hypothetical protein
MRLEARTGVRELLFRERAVAQEEQVRVAQNLRSHGADVYQGKGRLLDANTVLVRRPGAEERLTAKVILIATGSTPFHPPLFNFSAPGIYDSDSILLMSEVPHSLVVLGGGVIGCEYACTFAALGIPVTLVEEVTGFPEMLDGRVKTMHPKLMAGVLARRDVPEHMKTIADHGIEPIDMVVCSLYPFEEVAGRRGVEDQVVIENIDIGGPSMIRAAAKNHSGVAVVTSHEDYDEVLDELKETGELTEGALIRELRVPRPLGNLRPHPAKKWRLNCRRLKCTPVQHVVCEGARRSDGSLPERRVSDHARRLLGRAERAKLAHRAPRVDVLPRQRMKARVPEELVWVLHRIRTGVAEDESARCAAFSPVSVEDSPRARQYVGVRAHRIEKYAFGPAFLYRVCKAQPAPRRRV